MKKFSQKTLDQMSFEEIPEHSEYNLIEMEIENIPVTAISIGDTTLFVSFDQKTYSIDKKISPHYFNKYFLMNFVKLPKNMIPVPLLVPFNQKLINSDILP